MSLFDGRLFSWLRPSPRPIAEPPTAPQRRRGRLNARSLAGGRLSMDNPNEVAGFWSIVAPPDAEGDWRLNDLDTSTLNVMSPARLLELMVDLSPEISVGLWNFLRLCNPGWTAKALRLGSESEEIDTRSQNALDAFMKSCTGIYDQTTPIPFDNIINILFLSAFLRGAFLAELVLDANGRYPLNLSTPDPYVIRFKKIKDPLRGIVYQLGQFQDGVWVALNRETIRYVPVDPLPGKPYGRSIVAPALFTSLFLIGLLHDLRRVVAQQGYPRLDIAINLEKLADQAPPDADIGTEGWQTWVNSLIDEVQSFYSQLEPDDAYVHADLISVNRPVGTINADSLGMVDTLITKLERMAARAMKQMPLLFGIDEATNDANANRQWEIQAAGIKSIQHLAESLLEAELGLALQCQGLQARVRFRFGELRAAELLRDAMTEQLKIQNAKAKYDAGWISQDEASQEIVGHAADVPEPRTVSSGGQPPQAVPDDGDSAERTAELLTELRQTRTAVAGAIERQTATTPNGARGYTINGVTSNPY